MGFESMKRRFFGEKKPIKEVADNNEPDQEKGLETLEGEDDIFDSVEFSEETGTEIGKIEEEKEDPKRKAAREEVNKASFKVDPREIEANEVKKADFGPNAPEEYAVEDFQAEGALEEPMRQSSEELQNRFEENRRRAERDVEGSEGDSNSDQSNSPDKNAA